MDETKPIWQSKTIIGVLVTIAGLVLNQLGFDTGALNGLEGELVILAGALYSAYGRFKAVKRIG